MSGLAESIQMRIKGLMLDPASKTPIVILHESEKNILLPIWIGVFEANAIALRIEGIEPPRPMTHDLLFTLLETLETEVKSITISDLKDNTFYAQIDLQAPDGEMRIDARPSDAIALALRAKAPIYVLRSVLEIAQTSEIAQRLSDEEQLKKWLEDADPEDFGEYEM